MFFEWAVRVVGFLALFVLYAFAWGVVYRLDVAKRVRYRLQTTFPRWSRWFILPFLSLSTSGLCYLVAPLVVAVRLYLRHRWEMQNEENRREQERKDAERSRYVKAWFKENRATLYYNTIDGITAVLTPEGLAAAQRETRYDQMDGRWNHDGLVPCKVCVFVNTAGRERVSKITSKGVLWLSELHRLVDDHGVELIHCPGIFVPCVNEARVPFSDQRFCVSTGDGRSSLFEGLLESQVPRESGQ